jgi:ubiquinone biosynthesis protein
VAKRAQRLRRAVEVARVARRSKLIRVLRQVTVAGDRPATREAAQKFRQGLEELGTTYVKLGQLLSSRPDLLPDVYIEELSKLVDDAPPVPFEQIRQTIDEELGNDVFASIDPLRRQEQLVRGLRLLVPEDLRARGRAHPRRRPAEVVGRTA